MRKIQLLFCLLLLFGPVVAAAENRVEPLSNQAEISLITCGTGQELYALFGHTGLRVYDPILRFDRVYNYGMFDFSTPNFYSKFVKGDLKYFVDYNDYRDFIGSYAYEDRSVFEQHLQLNNQQKQEIWQRLNRNLQPDQRLYTYKFIDQNCTTKVADLLNSVLDQPIRIDIPDNAMSYRSILNTYLDKNFFAKLGINLIFGAKVDRDSQLLFLPNHLMEGLAITENHGAPLVDQSFDVYRSQEQYSAPGWNSYAVFSMVMLVLAWALKKAVVRKLFYLVMGLLGVFFIAVGRYSFHIELLDNNTVFLCNPLLMVLTFMGDSRTRFKKVLSIALLISVSVFILINLNSDKLIVTLPLVAVTLWSLYLFYQTQIAVKRETI